MAPYPSIADALNRRPAGFKRTQTNEPQVKTEPQTHQKASFKREVPLESTSAPPINPQVKTEDNDEPMDEPMDSAVAEILDQMDSTTLAADIPPQLNVTVHEHQRQGLGWMLAQESSHLRGGILADDMGLGKTVQTIALIYANPSRENRPTLIVCPLALINTWCSDLRDRVHEQYRLKVYVHHGPQRKDNLTQVVQTHQVVVTTYEVVSSELKALEYNNHKKHPLHNIKWHRIVLDEAHYIKNHGTKRSQAVAGLESTYRLCLSGTPMQNNLLELWPYLRFLRIEPYASDRGRFRKLVPKRKGDDPT